MSQSKECKNCVWFRQDHSDPSSPGCASCALGQNPTKAPCEHYLEKKDACSKSIHKQPADKEDDFDINIPWAMETFLGMT